MFCDTNNTSTHIHVYARVLSVCPLSIIIIGIIMSGRAVKISNLNFYIHTDMTDFYQVVSIREGLCLSWLDNSV